MSSALDEQTYHAMIGENLRRIREARGVSQVQLAANSGVALRVISKLENGGGGLRLITARRLALALNATVSDLIGESV